MHKNKKEFHAILENLSKIRTFVNNICKNYDISSNAKAEIELSVNEVCTNIIKHSGVNKNDVINIDINKEKDNIKVIISDNGKNYDIEKSLKINKAYEIKKKKPVSGMGFYIIKTLMDKVHHERKNDKNYFCMLKKI